MSRHPQLSDMGKRVLIREAISTNCPLHDVTILRFSENQQYFQCHFNLTSDDEELWFEVGRYTFIDTIPLPDPTSPPQQDWFIDALEKLNVTQEHYATIPLVHHCVNAIAFKQTSYLNLAKDLLKMVLNHQEEIRALQLQVPLIIDDTINNSQIIQFRNGQIIKITRQPNDSDNERGTAIVSFTDCQNNKCSIFTMLGNVWLGCDEIGLKRFDSSGKMIEVDGAKYIANNRMELNQQQVKELLPFFQRFAETGKM